MKLAMPIQLGHLKGRTPSLLLINTFRFLIILITRFFNFRRFFNLKFFFYFFSFLLLLKDIDFKDVGLSDYRITFVKKFQPYLIRSTWYFLSQRYRANFLIILYESFAIRIKTLALEFLRNFATERMSINYLA